jgi:hypothetical protein
MLGRVCWNECVEIGYCPAGHADECVWRKSRIALRANISETGLVLLINEQKGEKAEIRDEREFSRCCSFPWGFGCRGTKRRLASWRAAVQWSGSQSGRRSGAGLECTIPHEFG